MAVFFSPKIRKVIDAGSTPVPPVVPKEDMLSALRKFADGDNRRLMLIKGGERDKPFKVRGYDPGTGRVRLLSPDGLRLEARVGERENRLYEPLWY